MLTDNQCVDFARECVIIAGRCNDDQMREQLMNIARKWMAMAMHEETMPEPELRLGC